MGEAKRKREAEGEASDVSRRGVLLALGGCALTLPLGAWWIHQRSATPSLPPPETPESGPPEQATLFATLDTLLPSGEFPGHRETGVAAVLWSVAEGNGALRAKLQEGAELLDAATAGGSFRDASPEVRHQVLLGFRAAAKTSPQHRYYRLLRDQAMRLHYTHPASWKPLGFSEAPQPRGYPDYRQAPRG